MPQCSKCKHMGFVYSRRTNGPIKYCRLLATAADDNPYCAKFEELDLNDLRM